MWKSWNVAVVQVWPVQCAIAQMSVPSRHCEMVCSKNSRKKMVQWKFSFILNPSVDLTKMSNKVSTVHHHVDIPQDQRHEKYWNRQDTHLNEIKNMILTTSRVTKSRAIKTNIRTIQVCRVHVWMQIYTANLKPHRGTKNNNTHQTHEWMIYYHLLLRSADNWTCQHAAPVQGGSS